MRFVIIKTKSSNCNLGPIQTARCLALRRYLKELVQQGLTKKYILTPEIAYGQPSTQPTRESNLIAQYKAID